MVIDASVAFKLLVEEPDSDRAVDWMIRSNFVAPTLIHTEVANALWMRVLRKELRAGEEINQRLLDLTRYLRTVDEVPHMPRALEIAIELKHPIYDCTYLAIAEAEDDRLLTADGKFVRRVENTAYAERIQCLRA